ncbi:MAG: PAS domain [Geobacteraceae bacterium]|nr:MAG: PAS domain [Geobacteraceae bacterium]
MAMSSPDTMLAGKTVRILLVEDSLLHVELIREALAVRDLQIKLSVARSLAEARDKLAELRPDLAIVDLLLPDGSGIELLSAVRGETAFPIVILTSQGDEKEAVEAMKSGALDYLLKSPATLADMPHIVERALREWDHIVERRRAEKTLRESEERFRSVFTIAAAGMVIISPTGEILQANPAFCSLLGYSEAELAHLTIEDVTHPEDQDRTSLHYGEIFAGKRQHLHYEKRYVRKDGQTVWGHASVACVIKADRQALYCIGLVQDITDRKRVEEELREANRDLDAFVYTVSHDLRSPLTPIIGYTEFLREQYGERLDEQARNILTEVERQGHRMLGLLEDLLALSRVGHLERPAEPTDSNEVVREVMAGLYSQLANAGITVQTGSLPNLRIPETLLTQVFDNLIGNAIRYAGKDGKSIEVGGEKKRERVRFYVRDHGPGIPAEERSCVFDLFYRGSTGKTIEGTGVGLATVQKIARLHGGLAWVEETPGGGSTFWVEMVDDAST